MNSKLILRPLLLVVVLFFGLSFSFPETDLIAKQSESKSTWYNLFNKKMKKELAKADKTYTKGKGSITKASVYFKKAEGFLHISENAKTDKEKKKAYKNYTKNESKGIKTALKGYNYIFASNQVKNKIYSRKLESFEYDTSLFHTSSKKVSTEAGIMFKQAEVMKKNAKGFSGKQQYIFIKEAADLQFQSLTKRELAFELYEKSNDVDMQQFAPKKVVADTVQTAEDLAKKYKNLIEGDTANTYNPNTDGNVYKTRLTPILSKINIKKSDSLFLQKMYAYNSKADSLMLEIDAEYLVIDSIRVEAQKEQDRLKRDMITQKAVELEQKTFYKLIKSANLYIKANEVKYNIYKTYLPTVKTADTTKQHKIAKEFIISSDSIHRYVESSIANANLQFFKHEEYLQLMDANQAQLSALQQQENAFSTYFGWTTTLLPEPAKYKYIVERPELTNDSTVIINRKNKLEYNYLASFYYSVANPKPDTLIYGKGVFFKVQLGVFKNLLSLNDFGKYSPISFDTFKSNSYKRFMLGKYTRPSSAEYVLKELKAKGYTDAFIVGYINGKRTTYKKAREQVLVAQKNDDKSNKGNKTNKEIQEIKKNDKKIKKETQNFKYKNLNYGTGKYDFVQGVNIKNVKGLVYGVQVGMFQIPKTNEELKMIRPLMEEKTKKGTKLMKGPYYSYIEAYNETSNIRSKGFKQAYVTAYFDGQHITLSKAKGIEAAQNKEIKNPENNTESRPIFSVQIGAYSTELTAAKQAQFKEISKKYTITALADQNGLVLYIVGKYASYEETVIIKNDLKRSGFTDGFVIAFYNGRKINVNDAIKIIKNKKQQ